MDQAEFSQVWLPLWKNFYRAAYSILENAQESEDAVQELYLRLVERPATHLRKSNEPALLGASRTEEHLHRQAEESLPASHRATFGRYRRRDTERVKASVLDTVIP